jgi:type II secretory pathway pseudopilin PulG
MLKNQKAFTMIELLVSATIIILLTAAGLVSFTQAGVSSRNAKRKADLETMRQAMTLYKQDNGYYADSTTVNFATLVSTLNAGEYLSEAAIEDPKNNATYSYRAVCSSDVGGNCVKVTLTAILEPDAEAYDINAF